MQWNNVWGKLAAPCSIKVIVTLAVSSNTLKIGVCFVVRLQKGMILGAKMNEKCRVTFFSARLRFQENRFCRFAGFMCDSAGRGRRVCLLRVITTYEAALLLTLAFPVN